MAPLGTVFALHQRLKTPREQQRENEKRAAKRKRKGSLEPGSQRRSKECNAVDVRRKPRPRRVAPAAAGLPRAAGTPGLGWAALGGPGPPPGGSGVPFGAGGHLPPAGAGPRRRLPPPPRRSRRPGARRCRRRPGLGGRGRAVPPPPRRRPARSPAGPGSAPLCPRAPAAGCCRCPWPEPREPPPLPAGAGAALGGPGAFRGENPTPERPGAGGGSGGAGEGAWPSLIAVLGRLPRSPLPSKSFQPSPLARASQAPGSLQTSPRAGGGHCCHPRGPCSRSSTPGLHFSTALTDGSCRALENSPARGMPRGAGLRH